MLRVGLIVGFGWGFIVAKLEKIQNDGIKSYDENADVLLLFFAIDGSSDFYNDGFGTLINPGFEDFGFSGRQSYSLRKLRFIALPKVAGFVGCGG